MYVFYDGYRYYDALGTSGTYPLPPGNVIVTYPPPGYAPPSAYVPPPNTYRPPHRYRSPPPEWYHPAGSRAARSDAPSK